MKRWCFIRIIFSFFFTTFNLFFLILQICYKIYFQISTFLLTLKVRLFFHNFALFYQLLWAIFLSTYTNCNPATSQICFSVSYLTFLTINEETQIANTATTQWNLNYITKYILVKISIWYGYISSIYDCYVILEPVSSRNPMICQYKITNLGFTGTEIVSNAWLYYNRAPSITVVFKRRFLRQFFSTTKGGVQLENPATSRA